MEEIGALVQQRRKLVESEHRRLVAAQAMLSVEEAMTLIAQIVDIITTHVSDREALKGVMSGLQALGARRGNGNSAAEWIGRHPSHVGEGGV